MPSIRLWFIMIVALQLPVFVLGCGDDDEKKTIRGLREENKVLREKIAYLEARVKSIESEYTGKLNEKESLKIDAQLRLSQLQKENNELKSAQNLDERIVSHSNNALLSSFIISLILNVTLLVWVVFEYYRRRRIWSDMSQMVTERVASYAETGAANHEL